MRFLLEHSEALNLDLHLTDDKGMGCLHLSCLYGSEMIARLLIGNSAKYKISLKSRDLEGNTPFHLACDSNNIGNAKAILEKSMELDFDLCAKNNLGKTGYEIAMQKKRRTILACFRKLRPDLLTVGGDE